MDEIYISENLIELIKENPQIDILEDAKEMNFDIKGNLF